MIYVMLGTEKYPFIRLLNWMDRLKQEGIIEDSVLVQAGSTHKKYNYISEGIKEFDFVKHSEMNEHIDKARLVVGHAGVGGFLHVLSEGKIPLLIPRRLEKGEHLDNHQIDLVKMLHREYDMPFILTYKEFKEVIKSGMDDINIKNYREDLIKFLNDWVD